jgi:P-type Cu+ transporter
MITGESLPVAKSVGDEVIGATINKQGCSSLRPPKWAKRRRWRKSSELVEQAQGSKAPIQRVVDQVAAYFVPRL